jgi:hypothetical protein
LLPKVFSHQTSNLSGIKKSVGLNEQQGCRMQKQQLDIAIDDGVPDEVATHAVAWVEDIVNWLLSQPRPADISGSQPRYSEIRYTVREHARTIGLRNQNDGKGWLDLGVSSDLKFEQRGDFPSFIVLPTTTELGCRGNWAYAISQCNSAIGYFSDGFDWETCLAYQLKYLDHLGQSNRTTLSLLDQYHQQLAAKQEEQRLKKYWQQYPDSRAARLKRQREARAIHTPSWYAARWPDHPQSDHEAEKSTKQQQQVVKHKAPEFVPAPPAEPREPMPNCKTEEDEQWLRKYSAMYEASLKASSCEEPEGGEGAIGPIKQGRT